MGNLVVSLLESLAESVDLTLQLCKLDLLILILLKLHSVELCLALLLIELRDEQLTELVGGTWCIKRRLVLKLSLLSDLSTLLQYATELLLNLFATFFVLR